MGILRFVGLVIVCLAVFAFGISALAKAEPNAPRADAVVQYYTEAKFDEALALVQASAGGTITFLQSCPAIIFTSYKLIYKNVIIDGGNKITLSVGNTTRLFSLTIANQPGQLTLRNITLTHDYSIDEGGGAVWLIQNTALFTDNVIFELNQSDKYGNAIIGFGNAAITFNNTIVQSNTVLLSNLRFGAINSSGTLTITNSLLRGNRSDAQGGAITAIGKVLNQNTTLRK